MIRFCDREVASVDYNSISRQELLHYFLKGHLDEIVCIYDEYGYIGYTSYHTLLHSISLEAAIVRDVLILDERIWIDAKRMFLSRRSDINKHPLLPVVDRERNLVSFAYEDDDANRELRQIWELERLCENSAAVQFADMYPDCGCVMIYGFNELAYFFACYLKKQGIPVMLEDAMWDGVLVSDDVQIPEYCCMKIYAEGTWAKSLDWEENLLRTVSVEFECIDKIYEENIRRGYISNVECSCEDMLQKLKSAEAVAILGIDIDAQNSYDFLLQKGIRVECFVTWRDNIFERKLFGRPVYSIVEAVAKYGNSIVITDNHHENSAWGMGRTDYFEYLGYRRNEGYILLRDYTKISGNSLRTALKGQKIAMIGDAFLCERLLGYFKENDIICPDDVKYIVLPGEKVPDNCVLNVVDESEIYLETLWLVVTPEDFGIKLFSKIKQKKENVIAFLKHNKFTNYTDYFSFTRSFITIEKDKKNKYPKGIWKPGQIVMGSIEPQQGNALFSQLIDGHPSIMLMHMSNLSSFLFWFCVQMEDREADDIIPLFLYLYEEAIGLEDLREERIWRFIEGGNIRKLLKSGERYTSQELFVIFHVALYGKNAGNVGDMVIYWEPHNIPRNLVEMYTQWLGAEGVLCHIVNVTRNICMAKGSSIKWILNSASTRVCYQSVIRFMDTKKEEYEDSKRLVVRFEDLKCRPREELTRICAEWQIPWSDSLMETTTYGDRTAFYNYKTMVQDFDLEPVYNQYEEFFSEFDRFRIALICAPWQKKYGYPFVDAAFFSRKELQEMFLKDFRFKDKVNFGNGYEDKNDKMKFFISLQEDVRQSFQKLRLLMFTEEI